MTIYRHTQFGWPVFGPILTAAAAAWIASFWLPQSRPAMLLVSAALVIVVVLFGCLTIEVSEETLECRFGVGLIRRRIALARIREIHAVRNRWWYGWGVRFTPHGWLWNVSGLDAVELTFTGGKRFRLGTDEPEQLASALRLWRRPTPK